VTNWIFRAFVLSGAALVFGLALYDGSSPGSSSARSVLIPMSAAEWNVPYSPSMPAHPTAAAGGGWYFDFPSCGGTSRCSVNYVVVPINVAVSTSFKARFEIATTGKPIFHYKLKSDNTCSMPAHVRLFLERRGDDLSEEKEYWRWWSDPVAFQLAGGSAELMAALTPDQWISVLGKRGNLNPSSKDGFRQAINQVDNVGFTFGGGCFFGHGVNVTGGTARFYVTEYSVE
jgi:hypothetical protein